MSPYRAGYSRRSARTAFRYPRNASPRATTQPSSTKDGITPGSPLTIATTAPINAMRAKTEMKPAISSIRWAREARLIETVRPKPASRLDAACGQTGDDASLEDENHDDQRDHHEGSAGHDRGVRRDEWVRSGELDEKLVWDLIGWFGTRIVKILIQCLSILSHTYFGVADPFMCLQLFGSAAK